MGRNNLRLPRVIHEKRWRASHVKSIFMYLAGYWMKTLPRSLLNQIAIGLVILRRAHCEDWEKMSRAS